MAQQKAKTKGRKIANIVIWISAIFIVLVGLAIAGLQFFLTNSKPVIEGEMVVSILEDDVSVTRDEVGVPRSRLSMSLSSHCVLL